MGVSRAQSHGEPHEVIPPCYAGQLDPIVNRKHTALCIAALLALNIWIAARIFKLEFSPYMGSIEGAYVGLSRWLTLHWSSPGWFPLWYGGIPLQNSYPPFLHFLVAFTSMATGMSVVHSHHVVAASFYCLAPAALFWLVLRLTQSHAKAFLAGFLYSVVSPSAMLIQAVNGDVGTAWGARKLQSLIVYGESPHITSITLLLVALAAIHAALESRLGWRTVVAIFAAAAVALTNWIGAFALVCGVLALIVSKKQLSFSRVLMIGVVAYAVAMPWIPPSTIATVQRNAPIVGGNYAMGGAQYLFLAVWLATAIAGGYALKKTALSEGSRFALIFLFLMAVPPIGYDRFHIYPLPQPERYHLEFDVAFTLVCGIVLGSTRLASKRRWYRGAVVAALLCLAFFQVRLWRREVHAWLPPFDITKTVERAQAIYIGSHYPGQRVFATGSTRFWLNAFADNPQLAGGFDQGRSNPAIAAVTYAIPYVSIDGPRAVAMLKAYGVRTVAVPGPHSRDQFRDYGDPAKFNGVVPEVWRDGDDAIYEIPGTGSLTHVVNKADLVTTTATDWPAVMRFASALDQDHSSPQIAWSGPNHATIQAELHKPQVVSFQVSWDPGWRASMGGIDFATQRDAFGLLVLEPECEGRCTIELTYDGGMESRIARLLCLLGFAACGYMLYRGGVSRPVPQPPTSSL